MDLTQQGNNSKNRIYWFGWKDIAVYLKCSVRKAQRIEQRGLPVNRIPGTKSVWALKTAIDRWMTPPAKCRTNPYHPIHPSVSNDGCASLQGSSHRLPSEEVFQRHVASFIQAGWPIQKDLFLSMDRFVRLEFCSALRRHPCSPLLMEYQSSCFC